MGGQINVVTALSGDQDMILLDFCFLFRNLLYAPYKFLTS